MTADIVQSNYEELERLAAQFGRLAEANVERQSRIIQGAQALEAGWEGRGAAAFFTEMNSELYPAMERLTQALDEARLVMLQIKEIMQRAEEEAASVFGGEAAFSSRAAGQDSGVLDGVADALSWFMSAMFQGGAGGAAGSTTQEEEGWLDAVGDALGSAVDTVGGAFESVGEAASDFASGVWAEGKDMVTGLVTMVRHPIQAARGLWHGITNPDELWQAFKQPFVEDWEGGRPWRAIGRGVMFAGSVLVGTKGADKLAKASKLSRAAQLTDDVAEVGSRLGSPSKAARGLGIVRRNGQTETALARYIAEESTHRVDTVNRVVLGPFDPDPQRNFRGYIGEAEADGGIYYSTSDEVWNRIKLQKDGGNGRAWAVNREFLQSQLEQGVQRIELTGTTVRETLGSTVRRNSYTAQEIRYLQRYAYEYGYKQSGDTWVKAGDWRASRTGRAAGGSVGPGLDVIEDAQSLPVDQR